ncbi:ABC transporter permease [Euzebya sp.]|uniref:ABC transporter permease n=1 Tax=Euzebya sp. TaxID=1971409 RepID=UPI0035127A5C
MAEQTAPATADAQGVIHDIGYRHYDGPRLGRGYIRRSLFTESLRAAYGLGRSTRSKVMPMILLAVMCLPALAIVAITAVTRSDELVADYLSYQLNMQVVISIFVAAQAPALVSRDLRFGVMSLYFSRPLERPDYVLAKVGAMAAALLVLMGTPLVIMFLGALVVGLPLGDQVPDLLRALAGTALLAGILAGLGALIAAITPRRGLAVAAIVAVLVVLSGVQAVTQEIAIEQGAGEGVAYLGLLSPYTLVDGVQSGLLGATSSLPVPPGAGSLVFLGVGLLLVGGSIAALLARYRSVSVS